MSDAITSALLFNGQVVVYRIDALPDCNVLSAWTEGREIAVTDELRAAIEADQEKQRGKAHD